MEKTHETISGKKYKKCCGPKDRKIEVAMSDSFVQRYLGKKYVNRLKLSIVDDYSASINIQCEVKVSKENFDELGLNW